MRNVLNKTVRVKLGNGSDMELVAGRIIHINECSWSSSGRCNYYIEVSEGECKGLIARSVWIDDLPEQHKELMRKQEVEYYSTCVLHRSQYCSSELPKEVGLDEIVRKLQIARAKFIDSLKEDHDKEYLEELTLVELRDLYESDLSNVEIVEMVALPSGGVSRRIHKTKMAA